VSADYTSARCNTLIESLGVYLPGKEVSTEDVLRGCKKKLRFPLERMSGIKSRRVAGDAEFGIDLAKRAIERCLATSKYAPSDVDVVISASVGHCDGPDLWISFEPSTSVRLKEHFGFHKALSFDVASACSGMFVGIYLVDAMIKLGLITCGLVVSGEFISHLTTTAQKEIEGYLDPRLACLTLGDAGAAIMLEGTRRADAGFSAIDLCTLGSYATYCIAGPTDREHGGAVMWTDALRLTDAAAKHGSTHALKTMTRAGWRTDSFQHLIMHQTSSTALSGAMNEINRMFRRPVCHAANTIDNLANRGNTSSTTHFVALADGILEDRIRSGDRLVLAISGSGLTFGTALYTLDDLPDRMRGRVAAPPPESIATSKGACSRKGLQTARIRVESLGTAPRATVRDSMELLKMAVTDCLDRSSYRRSDISLLIYAGTYRSGFISEPAIASLLAGEMNINAAVTSADDRSTVAFDVLDGGVGVLEACHIAVQLIRARRTTSAMIVASEVENNAASWPTDLLGIEETGSALLLDETREGTAGFGAFLFRSFTQHMDAFVSRCTNRDGKAYLQFDRSPDLEKHFIDGIVRTVEELLAIEGLTISQIARIIPPQISSAFIRSLSEAMHLSEDRFVDAVHGDRDLFTSSIPFGLRYARDHGLVREGDIGMIVSVGSGVQVGCAIYYF
jgi:3-oxoacyl-[acyl-carrier-protein] synthase III